MRKLMYVLVAALTLAPASAEAQRPKGKAKRAPARVIHVTTGDHDGCCYGNRFSLEPYAGALKDAYDVSPDGEDTGYLVGFRVGYALSSRGRLLGNLGYSETNNVASTGSTPGQFIYDNTWIFTTAGGEFDVVPGRTSASLGLQGGAAWRRVDVDGFVGTPTDPVASDGSFAAQEVIIPSLMLRHRLTNRATIIGGLQDNIFDFLEGPARHSLAVTAGISFR
jgi:hypothetical protein